ncbi:MAG: VWA domain-containing protein [Bacteroidales bacterium]|nr:VWA domain-containing protein [Bacteroidales bacterium]
MNKKTKLEFIKTIVFYSLIAIVLYSCGAGNKEYFTVDYKNGDLGPSVEYEKNPSSAYISYDTIETIDLGNGTIQIIASGIRVMTKKRNYEISKINIYEEYNKKFQIQNEFDNLTSSNKTDIAVVLVLDMSTSLGELVNDLKEYAKNFTDEIVNSTDESKVAVVFFSSRDDIVTTDFYDKRNSEILKLIIDNFDTYKSRTALFQATIAGISLLDSLEFDGSKVIAIFTDGGDNDTDNPDLKLTEISSNEYLRITIGLEGEDFREDDLNAIASSKANAIIVSKSKNLEDAFKEMAKQIVSVYKVIYERSDQKLENPIEIKFEFEIDEIK